MSNSFVRGSLYKLKYTSGANRFRYKQVLSFSGYQVVLSDGEPLNYFNVDLDNNVIFSLQWVDKETGFFVVNANVLFTAAASGKFKDFINDYYVKFEIEEGQPVLQFCEINLYEVATIISIKLKWTHKTPF